MRQQSVATLMLVSDLSEKEIGMGTFKNLTGMRFGRLTVLGLSDDYVAPNGKHRKQYKCLCDCGSEKVIIGENLSRGLTLSCGCLQKERASQSNTKHGETDSRLYNIWCAMKRRCLNPNVPEYLLYGGRGISICDAWMDYSNFSNWANNTGYDSNAKRGQCTIDRIDVDGDYCPENCRWVTQQEQMNNVRYNHYVTYNGETHTIAEWARLYNMPYAKLSQRLNRYGYDIEKALIT